ncbi:MAG: Phasin [Spiribacter salinus]|uniref:Phasin n=1 Tax=Spiribacter salinus TaxID=1335746 RepID=A0A540VL72_9GAMM|nr:MAG: Phasin [Spiribacter salinus]
MTNADEYAKMMKDMMGSMPMDTSALQDAFKSQAAMMERMTKVALEAAEKSTEVSAKWTKATLEKAGTAATTKEDPAEYSQAMTDFASAQAELASEHASEFAEIAKKLQMDTLELLMAAGKDMQEDASAAVQKATDTVTNTAAAPAAKAPAAKKPAAK